MTIPEWRSQEHHDTLDAMERYGGGFIQALAVAWRKADRNNHAALYQAFQGYYLEYQRIGEGAKSL